MPSSLGLARQCSRAVLSLARRPLGRLRAPLRAGASSLRGFIARFGWGSSVVLSRRVDSVFEESASVPAGVRFHSVFGALWLHVVEVFRGYGELILRARSNGSESIPHLMSVGLPAKSECLSIVVGDGRLRGAAVSPRQIPPVLWVTLRTKRNNQSRSTSPVHHDRRQKHGVRAGPLSLQSGGVARRRVPFSGRIGVPCRFFDGTPHLEFS